jgi:hypothetical protein
MNKPGNKAAVNGRKGNARKHGLAVPIWCDPALAEDLQVLRIALAGPEPGRLLLQAADRAACAFFDLNRI